jgi:hypothetical protein
VIPCWFLTIDDGIVVICGLYGLYVLCVMDYNDV